jgi:hypothetical protein
MKHILKKTLLLLTSLIAVLALSACGSKTKIDLTEYVIVDISGVSGYAYAHAYDDNDRLEALVLGDENKDSAASWVKLDLLMQIDYDIDKSEYLSNGDTITVTVTYPEELAEALDAADFNDYVRTESFEEAVTKAAELAEPGDIVLLSPACTSWDMFSSFEERGRLFKKLVMEL